MSTIKRWNGSKWIDYLPKKWDGKKWIDAVVKRWNGKSWVVISETEYVDTWTATWTASYNGATNTRVTSRVAKRGDTVSHYSMWFGATWNQIVNWNGLKSPHIIYEKAKYIVQKEKFRNQRNASGWMYQGRASLPDKFSNDHGRQRSMIGFNHGNMRSKMSGAKIVKVEMYLRSKHFHNANGGSAVIGYHNSGTDKPANFSEVKNGVAVQRFEKRDAGMWITLPNSVGEALRDNNAKGLTLYANTDDLKRYGYFYGKGAGSEPQIRITYKK